jgi:hypothetical protein
MKNPPLETVAGVVQNNSSVAHLCLYRLPRVDFS